MAEIKELDKNLKISYGLAAYMIAGLVGATFALTSIYNQFLLMDEKIKDLEERIEYVDGRHDRKYERLQERVSESEDRVSTLELPNSDK